MNKADVTEKQIDVDDMSVFAVLTSRKNFDEYELAINVGAGSGKVKYDPHVTTASDDAGTGFADEASGWMVGLNWKDLFIDGNRAGLAVGSRVSATNIVGGGSDPSEDNSVWEAYYSFKVNDGVTVTPAVFGSTDVEAEGKDVTGAVLLTEFRF